jgi:glycosyltransferase involved in cell wall biosynthesis
MKKILFVSPHLSTGGLPQYLAKKIQNFSGSAELFCIEWNFYGPDYVVQRNKISDLLQERFFPINGQKEKFIPIVDSIDPDIIHFEELCESFIPNDILLHIFRPDRKYSILETCHSSTMVPESKVFRPDKFIMVSPWIAKKFSKLEVPIEVLEYPIEDLIPDKITPKNILGFSSEKKHILNVGLFTPGKNQKEVISLAEKSLDLPFQFHFVGNKAPNFKDYWEPILADLPENCKVWGERSDVDLFYQASDLFLFTSNLELSPLCIKEALSWKLPVLCKNLSTYMGLYDTNPNVSFLKGNTEKDLEMVLKTLSI